MDSVRNQDETFGFGPLNFTSAEEEVGIESEVFKQLILPEKKVFR
jgi:hypothetical protein